MNRTMLYILVFLGSGYLGVAVVMFFQDKTKPSPDDTIVTGLSIETPPKPEFHIKLVSDKEYWRIVFTNNNFVTEQDLMDVVDISSDVTGDLIVKPRWSSKDKAEAVGKAVSLHSFEECLAYNRKVDAEEIRLKQYRKLHPIAKREEPKVQSQEILIR